MPGGEAHNTVTDAMIDVDSPVDEDLLQWLRDNPYALYQGVATAPALDFRTKKTVAFNSDLTPAQITANQNDYNPTGLDSALRLRLDTDASRTLTGLAGGASGRVVVIANIGSNDLVIADEDANSTTTNRFHLEGSSNITISEGGARVLQYDSTLSRWTLWGGAGTGSFDGDVGGSFKRSGDITVDLGGGTVDDWAPTGIGTASVIRASSSAGDSIVRGISGGSDGRILTVINWDTADDITFKYDDSNSAAANRLILAGLADVVISPGEAITFWYDSTSSRWRSTSTPGGGGGSGTVDTSGTPVANDYARFTDADTIEGRSYAEVRTDLNIEDGADVTDTANVTAAGALMDSEVTNLAQVKAFDSTDYATAAQGATADTAMQDLVDDTTPQLGGTLDTNAKSVFWSKGADVASDASLALGTDGNYFDVTGTTTITTIDTWAVGGVAVLQFDGILTFTHHATNLILPTGANITTAAGDHAIMHEYAAGTWRCVSYQRADGTALAGSGGISNVVEDTTPQLGGPLDTNGETIHISKGGDVTAATTLNPSEDGNYFVVTGNTAITAITAYQVGTTFTFRFSGTPTLTHHATNLILPTGANITAAAGDVATFVEYATGTHRCISYLRADGTALAGSGLSNVVEDTSPQLGGKLDTNSRIIGFSKGADVASATTLNPGEDGNYFDVTGTTTIADITNHTAGYLYFLHFDDVLTLTHHVTDLILPGGNDITTAAGDHAIFAQYAAGTKWRCVSYERAIGKPIQGVAPDIILQDQKSNGTGAGASASGVQTRVLNTEVRDVNGDCSLSSNQFTLTAGTYYIEASAPSLRSDAAKAYLYNATDTADIIIGTSTYSGSSADYANVTSDVHGVFTIAASKALEIRQYTATAKTVYGLGSATSSGQIEVYSEVRLWRLS